ncbi:hypothetical protein SLE2022_239150 [Rubroshorea leprosula]
MARPLHLTSTPESVSQAGLAAAAFLFCAFALFMCASHSRKRWLRSACYEFFDEEPVIQQLNNEVVNTEVHGIQAGNEDEIAVSGNCEQPVWKKNILMGGKCQLPDYSGVIIYDAEGNRVTPAKAPRALLTWK